jgi:hypothetical protein
MKSLRTSMHGVSTSRDDETSITETCSSQEHTTQGEAAAAAEHQQANRSRKEREGSGDTEKHRRK